jgi:opacity protein-like surface antigen
MRLLLLAALAGGTLFATSTAAQPFFLKNQYVALSGGGAFGGDYTVDYPDNAGRKLAELQSSTVAQLAFGSRTGDVRLEGALSYRAQDVDTRFELAPGLNPPTGGSDEVTVSTLDINVYYDLPTGTSLRPYLGAGLGFAQMSVDDTTLDDEGSAVQVQGMIGASYEVSPRTAVFIEGRVQRVGDLEVDTFARGATGTDEIRWTNTAAMAGVRFGF